MTDRTTIHFQTLSWEDLQAHRDTDFVNCIVTVEQSTTVLESHRLSFFNCYIRLLDPDGLYVPVGSDQAFYWRRKAPTMAIPKFPDDHPHPWKTVVLIAVEDVPTRFGVEDAEGRILAEYISKADAELIAHAPDMLRLLSMIHGDAKDEHGKTVTYPENGEDEWLAQRDALLAEIDGGGA